VTLEECLLINSDLIKREILQLFLCIEFVHVVFILNRSGEIPVKLD